MPWVSEPELAAAQTTPRSHLYEIDVLRLLTFACVIAVHTVNYIGGFGVVTDALLTLLHFTRGAFFWLTAFVLTYGQLRRPRPLRRFWPRRFLLVGLPYVVWSGVYVFLNATISDSLGDPIARLVDWGQALLRGDAAEQLYFLLVTMQVYLLLPAIMWLVRRTRRHHVLLTVVALVVNLVVYGAYKYWPHSFDWMHGYSKQFFFMYVFFIVSGAVAADHAEAFLTWIRVRRRLIGWGVTGVGVLTLAVWAGQVLLGQSLYAAGTPLQPIEVVWSAAIGMGFLALGAAWADRRDPSTLLARVIDYGSDRSFGIFLSHPFVIFLLLYGDSWLERHVAQPWLTPVTYVLVIVLAVAITELFRWTPLSIPLTGRPSLGSRSAREARRRGRERLASAGGTTTTTARAVRDAGRERSSEAVEPDDALVGETDDVGGSHAER